MISNSAIGLNFLKFIYLFWSNLFPSDMALWTTSWFYWLQRFDGDFTHPVREGKKLSVTHNLATVPHCDTESFFGVDFIIHFLNITTTTIITYHFKGIEIFIDMHCVWNKMCFRYDKEKCQIANFISAFLHKYLSKSSLIQ